MGNKCNRRIRDVDDESITVFHICRYIQSHLDEQLTYANLQKRFFVGRRFLAVIFPKYVGVTVTNYIIDRRLELAVSLIQQGMSIQKAAAQSGFASCSNFFKQFRERYGSTPGEFFIQMGLDISANMQHHDAVIAGILVITFFIHGFKNPNRPEWFSASAAKVGVP